jgi:hypothetical protein
MAQQFKADVRGRGGPGVGRMGPQYLKAEADKHYVPGHPHKPFKGAHTKTARAPMSTSEYNGHMRRIK